MTVREFNPIWNKIPKSQQAWRKLLNNQKNSKLCIEIGAGAGLFAIKYSKVKKDSFLVSIERTKEKSQKLINRASNHSDIKNLVAISDDATKWCYENIDHNEVDEYFILYPNPYPKESQKNKRFFNMPFMHFLLKTLKSGGKITLATNDKFYLDEAYKRAIDTFLLTVESCCEFNAETINLIEGCTDKDLIPRTHFERKYLARGESCYNLTLLKS